MKFLVIQTAFIGDVILATALAEKLHRFYPDATIDFVLRSGNEGLLQEHPFIRNIFIWNKNQGKYRDLWRILKTIRAEQYDAVINCQRFAASGLLTAFSGAAQRIGFNKNPLSILFTRALPHHIGKGPSRFGLDYWHELDRNLSLIDHLTDATPAYPRLYPNTAAFLKAKPWTWKPYICIAPSSVWFTKQWPVEKWVELCRRIHSHLHIMVLGGKGDTELCTAIIEQCGRENMHLLAGQLNLLDAAALMQGAVMNYVNDSAPLHIATAMNAPVTAVFCSTIPEFGFTPLSDQTTIWQTRESLDCRPCGLHGKKACPKGHFRCAPEVLY